MSRWKVKWSFSSKKQHTFTLHVLLTINQNRQQKKEPSSL